MADALERIAREIDPMAWKAWEITQDIEVRRKVSVAKARTALLGIRELDPATFKDVTDTLPKEHQGSAEFVQATWVAVIDKLIARE